MAIHPDAKSATRHARLAPFEPAGATRIVSWVTSADEAYMLAPRTVPPITPARVLEWLVPGVEAFSLHVDGVDEPIGYGELNVLNERYREFWLGHLIVNPAHRGRGFGRELTRLLMERAFMIRGASRVSLVVFPENYAAVASYRAAGLYPDGMEHHDLPPYHCRARLLRMAADSLD